jgi:hypothetical protein
MLYFVHFPDYVFIYRHRKISVPVFRWLTIIMTIFNFSLCGYCCVRAYAHSVL